MKDRQANQDLWHLTIDDLLTPPAESPRLGGDGPFIINLSTSTAPIVIPPRDQLNIEGLHTYQISRTEDGRQRFRLRLGPISTELEADAILSAVRDRYPGAMIATAADDDSRAIASATRVAKSAKPARQAPPPAAKSVEHKAIPLPPQPTVASQDDPNEITGSGWDLDSLLPHLTGSAPTPKPKPAAAKAAPVAKKVAPPPPKAKSPAAAKPPAQKPAVTPAAAARPAALPPVPTTSSIEKAPAKMPAAQRPAAQETVAAPPILTTPAAPVARTKPAPTPPVLTVALERKPVFVRAPVPAAAPSPAPAAQPAMVATAQAAPPAPLADVGPTPPIAEVAPTPAPVEVAPPPPAAEVAAPVVHVVQPVVAEVPPPAVEIVPPPAAAITAPPTVEFVAPPVVQPVAPPIAAVTTPEPVITPAPPKTAVFAPLPPLTLTKPRTNIPVQTKSVPATPPVKAAPPVVVKAEPAQPIARLDIPPADPLETDWAAILSAPVEDTASRPAFTIAVEPASVPAPVQPAAIATPVPFVETRASEDSGLQRLVDKSNALVDELETRNDAVTPEPQSAPAIPTAAEVFAAAAAVEVAEVAKVVEVAPVTIAPPAIVTEDPHAVIFSPLNTQSIEQKLAKLAEILHVGEHVDSPACASSTHAAPMADVPVQADREPVAASPATAADDIELFFDDDTPLRPSTAAGTWPLVERRQEPRPELKSPADVVTSIDDMIVVDEANNLDDVVAKQTAKTQETVIDSTAQTDQVPILNAPRVDIEVDLSVDVSIEEPRAQAQPETPPVKTSIVDASASARAIALVLDSDLSLEPELTLAPSEEAPPPVFIEDLILSDDDKDWSLAILIEENKPLVETLETAPKATTPAPPPIAAPITAPIAAPIAAPVELKLVEPARPEPVAQSPVPPASVAPADDDIAVVSTVVLEKPAPKPQTEEPHVRTIVLEPPAAAANAAPVGTTKPINPAQAAPVVIRTRESTADSEAKNAGHVSARAAARAAKKLRVSKHAAKLAALAAAKNGDAAAEKPQPASPTPVKMQSPAVTPPAPQPTAAPTPPPKSEAPAPKAAASAAKPAPVQSRKPSQKPQPTASKPQAAPAKPSQSAPPKPAAAPSAQKPQHAPAAASANGSNGAATPERKVTIRTEHSPDVDSTQTMRALTPLELADDQVSKWFVIQLAVSDDDFDPDQIPHLDIFEAYRLYAVIGLDKDRILHALRLGFFSDEISASAVTSYVKTHFEGAVVKRVSVAERERFAESRVAARKNIGATGVHTIIEMASPKPVPETRLADLAASSGERQPEEKSIWSRLVSPLKRQ